MGWSTYRIINIGSVNRPCFSEEKWNEILAVGMFGLLASFILWLISGKITLGKTACWKQKQQAETAKKTESWIVDNSNGTMYFFLDNEKGWRLVVLDAALGSRFYGMEKTEDGGSTWEQVNENPFQDRFGVTEGLIFFDEALGVAGIFKD